MIPFAKFDESLIQSHVTEFQTNAGLEGELSLLCLHKASDSGRDQMVFHLQHENGQAYVLKKDFIKGKPWIEREFHHFQRLMAHFEKVDHSAIVTPLYLGQDKSFHICDYIPGRTASDILKAPNSQKQKNQVFRRAGRWLDHLHRFQDPKPEQIWTNWIFDEAKALVGSDGRHAKPVHYERFLETLQQDATQFQACPCPRVLSHGDYHSGNLILGSGTAFGLDLAYAKEKPLLYDVVDFLLSDVNLELNIDAIGPGGIHWQTVAFFFKTYRFAIDTALLNFHLRSALLLKLLKYQTELVEAKPRRQKEFDETYKRLDRAFSQPLSSMSPT